METTDSTTLPSDIESLKALVVSLQGESKKYQQLYYETLEKWQLSLKQRFAASCEGYPGQGELFNEAEELLTPSEEEVAADETITYTRKKTRRPSLAAELPRENVVHDIDDADKVCNDCGNDLHRMGEEVSEKLEFIPATVKVIRHIRPKYSCRCCENNATQTQIKIAPVPASILPKSIATPTLLAQIISAKYQFGLPLHRQEALFKSFGIELHRQTMSRWLVKLSEQLEVLYEHWHQQILRQPAIWSDDTPVKVIETEKSQCYMWVYGCGEDKKSADGPPNIVLYDYQDGRAGTCPQTFLKGYTGLLQVDGYAGYNHTEATLVGCWAHARRKFIEAKAVQPKGKTGRADQALNLIQKLYGIETSIANATPEYKLKVRQEQSAPIMQQLKTWLDKTVLQVPPKTAIGKALQYSLNQWSKLTAYLEHGLVSIDNNRAERAIKPFVIGRKNWLFSNTRSGAKASAILYSLVETAKANDLQPAVYLQALFKQLPHIRAADIDTLSPWNIKLN
ncbi:IS66 family transposase [Thiopseudomonas alkaliphila]|uniref:IS66 family transposase n=1 Tax=Thiopseudomonas alkaliphila TaxID=1697053 RepID=A0AAW7DTE2_9GAMM|nr:IS66 family transposase [Thiopseudomonas alkaliphila]MDM1697399.1 IS66 family transposase [Thiopseudomonas alkaliphila]MDM1717479.1 IS66 family transposase [Thiopseudomonas alkaliphila]